jgi:DNA-binding response OmpR family regulator
MSSKPEPIERPLHNGHILIVEDDVRLAERIVALFKEYSSLEPSVAHCMEQATDILSNSAGFDLLIMDVMLPKTQEDFIEVQELKKILGRARAVTEKYGSQPLTEKRSTELNDARYRRAQALKLIDDLIVQEGGIALIEEWRNTTATQNKCRAILYLTSVGSLITVERGLSDAREISDWIIKPISSNEILRRCAKLLQKVTGSESEWITDTSPTEALSHPSILDSLADDITSGK